MSGSLKPIDQNRQADLTQAVHTGHNTRRQALTPRGAPSRTSPSCARSSTTS
jgi:hypothetical protein